MEESNVTVKAPDDGIIGSHLSEARRAQIEQELKAKMKYLRRISPFILLLKNLISKKYE